MKKAGWNSGSMVIWNWSDYEIENPRVLREQLAEIESRGFCGVIATLRGSRYEIVDKKVVRAISQASQWAKARLMVFMMQADPRRASRTLIAETGERSQCLLFGDKKNGEGVSLGRLQQGRFNIRYEIPACFEISSIQEKSVFFEPCCLERAFLFQMEDGQILLDSLLDITSASRFFANIGENEVEIFGEAGVAEGPHWQILALPKFNTNVYDFAGRESNDLMHNFVENLFDSAAYIDAVAWDELGVDFMPGTIPVSESIYKGFIAENGYDIRDHLYALILEVDDGSHTRIRYDYTRYLADVISSAHNDLLVYFNSYFGSVDAMIPYSIRTEAESAAVNKQIPDPGLMTSPMNLAFSQLQVDMEKEKTRNALLARAAVARSEGLYSTRGQAFVTFDDQNVTPTILNYMLDFLAFFSLRWVNQAYRHGKSDEQIPLFGAHSEAETAVMETSGLNQRLGNIFEITRFRFQTSRTAVVLPVETLVTMPSDISREITQIVLDFIGRLILKGVSVDVLRSPVLEEAKLSPDGVRIRNRAYQSLIFPYAMVISQPTLDLIATMRRMNMPVFFGGERPEWLTSGERIHHDFDIHFDPEVIENDEWIAKEAGRDFELPEETLAAVIYDQQDRLILVMPDRPGKSVKGSLKYQGIAVKLAHTHRLQIMRLSPSGEISREL